MDLKLLRDTPPWDWPDDTGELLLAVLRDPRSARAERLLAAELAGDSTVINDELAETLISIVGRDGEPEDLRGQAAISLGPALEDTDTAFPGDGAPEGTVISEAMFDRLCEAFHRLFQDEKTPKLVRRRILEASVRAPQDWHRAAIEAALARSDEEWELTAVFCMQFVRGFDAEILAAIESPNPDIRREAVQAAGDWALAWAWPHVSAIVTGGTADKDLLLAAIAAVAYIRPAEACEILSPLEGSDDEEIAAAASDAVAEALAQVQVDDDEDDEDQDDEGDDDDRLT
jgi:hypothetical protein